MTITLRKLGFQEEEGEGGIAKKKDAGRKNNGDLHL